MSVRGFGSNVSSDLFLWSWSTFIIFGGMFVVSGCTSEKPQLESFPVHGRVLVNGKPPVRAEIRLRPKVPIPDPLKRSIEPYAYVQKDGTFEVGTYVGDDGAPPGDYAVTLTWPTVTIEGGEESIGPDQLKGQFADPAHPIARVKVEAEEKHIPLIELKTE